MQASNQPENVIDPRQFNAYQRRAFGQLLGELTWRIQQLQASDRADALKLVTKLENCCRNPCIVTISAGSDYYLAETRCRSRVCPRCARIRGRKLATRIHGLIHQMDDPRFLTLTIRSTDQPLAAQIKHLRRRFAAMRRHKLWKRHVHSGVYTIEITWNDATSQWHPHLHAIIDGTYWPQDELLALWEQFVEDQAGVDIRAVRGVRKLANYLACYVAKSCDLDSLPGPKLTEWATETHGLRLAQTFGSLHSCKPQSEPAEPLPHRLVEIDVNDLAYNAWRGVQIAEAILSALEPRGKLHGKIPAKTIGGQIMSFNHPFPAKERPPPRHDPNQLHLLN